MITNYFKTMNKSAMDDEECSKGNRVFTSKQKYTKKKFADDQAEVSGDECSSDESGEVSEEEKKRLEDFIVTGPVSDRRRSRLPRLTARDLELADDDLELVKKPRNRIVSNDSDDNDDKWEKTIYADTDEEDDIDQDDLDFVVEDKRKKRKIRKIVRRVRQNVECLNKAAKQKSKQTNP